MKIINGASGIGVPLTESEVDEFLLSGKRNLFLGTLDKKNEPNIHPLWYLYEKNKLYVVTETNSKKIQNIMNNNLIYFSVAEDEIPFKGVRGKGLARIINDAEFNFDIASKIVAKYMDDPKNRMALEILNEVRSGAEIAVEINPKYFSTTNFQTYFHTD